MLSLSLDQDPVCTNCSDLQFYDIWVAHDQTGTRFSNEPPFITSHAPSRGRLARLEPFPVFSCWNGMVVIKADLFQAEGLRFRTHAPFECGASECELFNRDMWAIGRRRILMVPSVITAYVFRTFVAVNNRRAFRPLLQWEAKGADADAFSSDTIDFSYVTPPAVTCCNLATGESIIDWWNDCFPETEWERIHALLGSPPTSALVKSTRGSVPMKAIIPSALVARTAGGVLDDLHSFGDLRGAIRRIYQCGNDKKPEARHGERRYDDFQPLAAVGFRQIKDEAIRLLASPCQA